MKQRRLKSKGYLNNDIHFNGLFISVINYQRVFI